ncbi:MAG: hypothetical protein WB777_14235 [Mycobacterium sp.]
MASDTCVRSTHQTIASGSTAETITFSKLWAAVEVMNESTTATIDFTVDGTTPTVGGKETYRVLAGQYLVVEPTVIDDIPTVVLISATQGAAYTVTGVE